MARPVARLMTQMALVVGLTAAGACFNGNATVGAVCRRSSDCGGGQTCDNEICGLCGDGESQPGELCFREGQRIELGLVGGLIRPQDVDRDGMLDLVGLQPGLSELTVLRGDNGTFEDPESVALPGPADLLAVGDLDSDETVDAVTANGDTLRFGAGSGALVFSFGTGGLEWGPTTALLFVPASEETTPFVAASRPIADSRTEVAALEVGADGVLRIGVSVSLPGTVVPLAAAQLANGGALEVALAGGSQLYLRSGRAMTAVAELAFEAQIATVALVDANGDGTRDVLTADVLGNVVLDVGHGDGTFSRREPFVVAASPRALIVADLDRDGDRDIAVASASAGLVLALARGTQVSDIVALPGPSAVADVLVANLNGDVLPELIVWDAESGAVVVLEVDP
ncbi:MAG: VCBS repeat-containing protein [Nannocystaceae bacterium]|nr:VCBS repeat-containing protein [Nannocystaceae bacterium]